MKHYLATIEVRDGSHEHTYYGVLRSRHIDTARKRAERSMDREFGFRDDETMQTLRSIHEISASDFETLKRLGVASGL